MAEATTDETPGRERPRADAGSDEQPRAREAAHVAAARVLLVADEGADVEGLAGKLASAGFEVARTRAEEAARTVEGLAPAVVLLAFGGREGEGRLLALARRLRGRTSSFALPIVFLYGADGRALRSAAQHLGADDYFAQDATAEEMGARLASLLWRVEAGRRSAPAVADQRSEIDNFLFLLDAVGSDARDGATGSLALVEAGRGADADADATAAARRSPALTDAHAFLKLNLRRLDAVAFYGPATLLVYLAGADAAAARATLSRLREEFSEANPGSDLFVGVSSFPAHGSEVERLVEQAEAALGEARGENSATRVVVYGVEGARAGVDAERRRAASAGRGKTRGVVDEPATAATKGAATGAQAGERRAGGRLRRVMLVVSDPERMAQINLLMRSAAYEVRAAFDGHHALNLLRIDRPDALVVDYSLHEMDGVEMLRRLGKQSRTGHAPPTLLLVPDGREDLRSEALGAGARRVLDMHYDAVELLDALRELCETD